MAVALAEGPCILVQFEVVDTRLEWRLWATCDDANLLMVFAWESMAV